MERVAIIGGGIAGLSLAHALLSSNIRSEFSPSTSADGGTMTMNSIEVEVFESRPGFDYELSGSGIQLTGGMVALRRISTRLQRIACDAALPLLGVTSRCRPWFGDGGRSGNDVEGWKILDLDVRRTILDDDAKNAKNEHGDDNDIGSGQNRSGLVTEDGEVLAYAMMRGTLQRVLHESLVDEYGLGVTFDRRLSGISYASHPMSSSKKGEEEEEIREGIICEFEDGSTSGTYDLVVGCDGIQSAVRRYVNDGAIRSDSSSSSSSAIYSGLRITFAIRDGDMKYPVAAADVEGCRFNQYFGNGAYALTSSYGTGTNNPPARGAFVVYPDENYIGPFRRPGLFANIR